MITFFRVSGQYKNRGHSEAVEVTAMGPMRLGRVVVVPTWLIYVLSGLILIRKFVKYFFLSPKVVISIRSKN